ncbi:hypothetical protein NP493_203g04054 [Ridgeia piscesae]|uniref:Uncharacterized protein n=1 Tax=Ridgeia piscesae TaxID=27915 RepID=A0AAD9P1B7_RIDPI|nr:hypothetical protein NP493_203g04054 [Ridgeia piscesae]
MITTYANPSLALAIVAMELLNHLYMSGAVPTILICRSGTGTLPFSAIFNVLLFVVFFGHLPVEVSDIDSAGQAAGMVALVYGILLGQKSVTNLEELGHLLPEVMYVFLLVFTMIMAKLMGDQIGG